MKRIRYGRERWQHWVAQQVGSGLGVRAFCEAKGLPENSFYNWRKKLKDSPHEKPEIKSGTNSEMLGNFVQLDVASAPQMEIRLPCGATVVMHVDQQTTHDVLTTLLAAEPS